MKQMRKYGLLCSRRKKEPVQQEINFFSWIVDSFDRENLTQEELLYKFYLNATR